MKKFIFRLETLLKVRKAREKRLQRDLAFARQKREQWFEKTVDLERQIEALNTELAHSRERHLDETYGQILHHLTTSYEAARQSLEAQQQHVELLQERLHQAIQERKVIEKIKEKHYSQWRVQAEKIET